MEFNRFDVSTKELVWDDPAACLDRFGVGPPGPVQVIDSDATTLTAAVDKVIKVGGQAPTWSTSSSNRATIPTWSGPSGFARRLSSTVTGCRCSRCLVLLRRDANSPSLSGSFEIRMPDGSLTNLYNYRVVRLWQEDPESYLSSGVNLVPLAPLTNVAESGLPGLVQRMAARINAESPPRSAKLWTATYLLMGLSYSEEVVAHLLEGVMNMQESTTYQAILREGRQEG